MTTETQTAIPVIGQSWPEQGGIYIGSRVRRIFEVEP